MIQRTADLQPLILISHGLNLKPEKMADLSLFFQRLSFETKIITLPGHGDGEDELWRSITPEIWRQEVENQYLDALVKCKNEKKDLYICAYSLSALLFQDLFLRRPEIKRPKKIIYFAPAIHIKKYKYLINFMAPINPKAIIPSINLKEYRKWPGTSLNAYKSLNQIEYDVIYCNNAHWAIDVPTLIIIDPKDELIKYNLLKKSLGKKIQIMKISKKTGFLYKFGNHHLIIDRSCLDKKTWEKILTHISEFI